MSQLFFPLVFVHVCFVVVWLWFLFVCFLFITLHTLFSFCVHSFFFSSRGGLVPLLSHSTCLALLSTLAVCPFKCSLPRPHSLQLILLCEPVSFSWVSILHVLKFQASCASYHLLHPTVCCTFSQTAFLHLPHLTVQLSLAFSTRN